MEYVTAVDDESGVVGDKLIVDLIVIGRDENGVVDDLAQLEALENEAREEGQE